MSFCDAHNHLQDSRFSHQQAILLAAAESVGVRRMVVNGACADDWPEVLECSRLSGSVLPSFGWHPWYLHEMHTDGLELLEGMLTRHPMAAVGEIGLDRWILDKPPSIRSRFQAEFLTIEPASMSQQVEVFVAQWRLAVQFQRPITVHCLNAWGSLLEILRAEKRAPRGFLLHSYGGSAELVPELTRLGAYFSFPGYFALERKRRQREVFHKIPRDRLLVETDAPDQVPPEELIHFPLFSNHEPTRVLNHPANLPAIYKYLANWLGTDFDELQARVEENFIRLFGT